MFSHNIAVRQNPTHRRMSMTGLHTAQLSLGNGGSNGPFGSFMDTDGTFNVFKDPDELEFTFAETSYASKWKAFAEKILKDDMWSGVKRLLDKLPEDIVEIYERVEAKHGIRLDEATKKTIYKQFNRMAATSYGDLHSWEVEALILSDDITAALQLTKLTPSNIRALIQAQLEKRARSNPDSKEGKQDDLFDFQLFTNLLYEIVLDQRSSEGTANVDSPFKFWKRLLPIDPDSPKKQLWDIFVMLLLVYCSFEVPYTLAFGSGDSDNETGMSSVEISAFLIDCLFMLDIAASFVTAYDKYGYMVKKLRDIGRHYLRTWFLFDLAGSFPFDAVIKWALSTPANGVGAVQIMRIFKVVRMLRLLRAVKFLNKLNEFKDKEGFHIFENFIGIFRAVFIMIFVAHAYGSFFVLLASDGSDPNWLSIYQGGHLADADDWSRYTVALYWAVVSLTTMGYGDVIPANQNERFFCILVALTGAIVFSFCMGTIASLISAVKNADDCYKAKIQTVQEYLSHRNISLALKRKIKNFYAGSWRKSGYPYQEFEILGELTKSLNRKVLKEIGFRQQKLLPVLQGFDDECIGYVYSRLNRFEFDEGDVIYERGDEGDEMFFITTGQVRLNLKSTSSSSSEVRKDGKQDWRDCVSGDTFGEIALFPEISETDCRPDSATALSWVTLFSLPAFEIPECERRYPDLVTKLREYCLLKVIEYRSLNLLPVTRAYHLRKTDAALCIRSSVLQKSLLLLKETTTLKKAAGDNCSEVLKLMRPAKVNEGRHGEIAVQNISCAISSSGEVMYLEHSLLGLAADKPQSFGYLIPSQSTYRSLSAEDMAQYVAKRGKILYGCALLVFPCAANPFTDTQPNGSDRPSTPLQMNAFKNVDHQNNGTQLHLLSSSEEVFKDLEEAVKDWVVQAPPSTRVGMIMFQKRASVRGDAISPKNVGHLDMDVSKPGQGMQDANQHDLSSKVQVTPEFASRHGSSSVGTSLPNVPCQCGNVKRKDVELVEALNDAIKHLERLLALAESTASEALVQLRENRRVMELLQKAKTMVDKMETAEAQALKSLLHDQQFDDFKKLSDPATPENLDLVAEDGTLVEYAHLSSPNSIFTTPPTQCQNLLASELQNAVDKREQGAQSSPDIMQFHENIVKLKQRVETFIGNGNLDFEQISPAQNAIVMDQE